MFESMLTRKMAFLQMEVAEGDVFLAIALRGDVLIAEAPKSAELLQYGT